VHSTSLTNLTLIYQFSTSVPTVVTTCIGFEVLTEVVTKVSSSGM
jgi:hypothetical protein